MRTLQSDISYDIPCSTFLNDWNGRTVVDVGCGNGSRLKDLCERGAFCYGLDISRDILENNRSWSREAYERGKERKGGFCFIQAASGALPFISGVADLVLCTELIEHVEQTHEVIQEIYRILIPGQYCVLSFPVKWVEKILCFFCQHFSAFSGHVKQFSLAEMKEIVQAHGFRVVEVKPWYYEWSLYFFFKALFGQIPKIDRRGKEFWSPPAEADRNNFLYYYARMFRDLHKSRVGKFFSFVGNWMIPKSYFLILRKEPV